MDVFLGTLEGLLLAETEFDSAADADALTLPSFIWLEVFADNRFTWGTACPGVTRADPGLAAGIRDLTAVIRLTRWQPRRMLQSQV